MPASPWYVEDSEDCEDCESEELSPSALLELMPKVNLDEDEYQYSEWVKLYSWIKLPEESCTVSLEMSTDAFRENEDGFQFFLE